MPLIKPTTVRAFMATKPTSHNRGFMSRSLSTASQQISSHATMRLETQKVLDQQNLVKPRYASATLDLLAMNLLALYTFHDDNADSSPTATVDRCGNCKP